MKIETNRKLQEEVLKKKMECKDAGDYRVSFLDLDGALPQEAFGRDGVHLNKEGDKCMSQRMLEWICATERLCRLRKGKEVDARE